MADEDVTIYMLADIGPVFNYANGSTLGIGLMGHPLRSQTKCYRRGIEGVV